MAIKRQRETLVISIPFIPHPSIPLIGPPMAPTDRQESTFGLRRRYTRRKMFTLFPPFANALLYTSASVLIGLVLKRFRHPPYPHEYSRLPF